MQESILKSLLLMLVCVMEAEVDIVATNGVERLLYLITTLFRKNEKESSNAASTRINFKS